MRSLESKVNPVLAIDTYAKISPFLVEMWPHYEKACLPIVGIERTNAPTTWPKDVLRISVGEDSFTSWAEHRSPTLLPKRCLDALEALLGHPALANHDSFLMAEWDTVFLHPFDLAGDSDVYAIYTGKTYPGFKATKFFHMPWLFTRRIAPSILTEGRKMIEEGDTELGSPDFFLGRLLDRTGIPWQNIPSYTANKITCDYYLEPARQAKRAGVFCIHGIQDSENLRKLMDD